MTQSPCTISQHHLAVTRRNSGQLNSYFSTNPRSTRVIKDVEDFTSEPALIPRIKKHIKKALYYWTKRNEETS